MGLAMVFMVGLRLTSGVDGLLRMMDTTMRLAKLISPTSKTSSDIMRLFPANHRNIRIISS